MGTGSGYGVVHMIRQSSPGSGRFRRTRLTILSDVIAMVISTMLLLTSTPVMANAKPKPKLDLTGYIDSEGVISVLYKGETADPYFALQSLLLAQEDGLDISSYARTWARWLVAKQKPDATFDRFCRTGPVWAPCKTADADDALLAMWMIFLDTMPDEMKKDPVLRKSYQDSAAALRRLRDGRGIYLVSPVFQQGLFMDNLEVWSYPPARQSGRKPGGPGALGESIHAVFWDDKEQRFLVSTQPEQRNVEHAFYPEHVAQIFPLLVDFPLLPTDRASYYKRWMKAHRQLWLKQVQSDFAWGLIAVIALRQGDSVSAGCWLRESSKFRHTAHWAVTDEVSMQILKSRKVVPADARADCK